MASQDDSHCSSEPLLAKAGKSKDRPYYLPSIDKYLIPKTRYILENYSGISQNQHSDHVHKIREQAWAIRAYPCVGQGLFLTPYIVHSPAFAAIVQRLKRGHTFMDIGCLMGGDTRALAFAGAPTDKMYGVDIVSHWDIGYDLYRDEGRFAAHFIEADYLSADNAELQTLRGSVDVISASAVLHLGDWNHQLEGAKHLIKYTRPGSIIVGHQIGNIKAQPVTSKAFNTPAFRQNPASWAELWNEAGMQTGTKWRSEARLVTWEDLEWDPKDFDWMEEGVRVIDFVVMRTV